MKFLLSFVAALYPLIMSAASPDASPAASPERSEKEPLWDSTAAHDWQPPYEKVAIPSTLDGAIQQAYIYRSTSSTPVPLVVNLHTWSGDYTQFDGFGDLVKNKNWNFIHPDFRGSNTTPQSCASKYAIQDVDDAIAYALKTMPVDPENIFITGTSGGGMMSCVAYLNTRHPIRATFAWVPITDLEAWYYQSAARKNKYAKNILTVTGSSGKNLNADDARSRSSLYMPIPKELKSPIHLFAGIDDGYSGSVPISHTLLFYNRMAEFAGAPDKKAPESEIIAMLSRGKPSTPPPGYEIDGRKVLYHQESPLATVTIFQGGHEMLVPYCFSRIEQIVENK